MRRKTSRPAARRAPRTLPPARRAAAGAIAAWAALLVCPLSVAAQCALCGQGTRYAGTSPERAVATLLAGTIVLLLPPVSVAVLLGRFLWKHRGP